MSPIWSIKVCIKSGPWSATEQNQVKLWPEAVTWPGKVTTSDQDSYLILNLPGTQRGNSYLSHSTVYNIGWILIEYETQGALNLVLPVTQWCLHTLVPSYFHCLMLVPMSLFCLICEVSICEKNTKMCHKRKLILGWTDTIKPCRVIIHCRYSR